MKNRFLKRALNPAEREAYLREALGMKKIARDGKSVWIRDPSHKQPRLQYGAPVSRGYGV